MNREKSFKLKVSTDEYRRWSKEARDIGVSVAEWVRRRCQTGPDEMKEHRGYAAIQCKEGEIVQVWSVPLQKWVRVDS